MPAKAPAPAAANTSEGIDLVVTDIKIEPSNPAVRERIAVSIEVKNQGTKDLEKEILIPMNVRFEGMGMKIDQVSRNFKDGIKAGETVSINKNLNGPWVGTLSFSSDVVGEYNLNVSVDNKNEITESNKKNNTFNKKVSFTLPANLKAFSMERAIRSYASVAPADSLVSLLRKSASLDANGKSSVTKAISEGWNYRKKDVKLNDADKAFLTGLNKTPNERLTRVLIAWNVVAETKLAADVKAIKIRTIKEAMKYDLKEFTVKPGQTVEITFENPDAMAHNMVIVKPKMMSKVGQAGDKMMKDKKGLEKNYVPAMPEVLFSTPLVNPGQTYKLTFKAPETAGDYPYVCTFPGHWTLMNGVMKVVR